VIPAPFAQALLVEARTEDADDGIIHSDSYLFKAI
jgi:hypothetical protein